MNIKNIDNMLFGEIKRFEYGENCTLGEFRLQSWDSENIIQCKTLERHWNDNKVGDSCIPEGEYDVRIRKPYESGSFDYDHLLIENVPDRSYILFHAGNYFTQIAGCVLVGHYHRDLNNDNITDVGRSRDALRDIIGEMNNMKEDRFKLKIHSEDV